MSTAALYSTLMTFRSNIVNMITIKTSPQVEKGS